MAELTIRPEEIRDALERFVAAYEPGTAATEEVGTVVECGDGIARVSGLPSAMANELMEFEDGRNVAELLREPNRRLPADDVRRLAEGLLSGLGAVHAQGFLHRDIKPANIIIRRDSVPILVDFGAARQAMGGRTQSLTGVLTPLRRAAAALRPTSSGEITLACSRATGSTCRPSRSRCANAISRFSIC